MTSTRRRLLTAGALVGTVAVVVAATSAASGARQARQAVTPVIDEATTAPARPLSGKRFTISFRVTRSDTGAPLLRGRMVGAPSVAGKLIKHAESFKAGTARVSFVVPASATGRLLTVKVTIVSGGRSATRVTSFRVLRGTPLPLLSIGETSVVEGNDGAKAALSFTARLSAAEAQTVTVRYATADGAATAAVDYLPASGMLTFNPGSRTQTITVAIIGDRAVEPTETLTVVLSKPTSAKIAVGSATGTITDDDARSGHYAGTTSQGLPIELDVTENVMVVENLRLSFVMTCDVIGVNPYAKGLNFSGAVSLIGADLSFQFRRTSTRRVAARATRPSPGS
jgi:hypothetical protein